MLNRWNFLKTGFYEGIKFGASFILATQSLAKLSDLSRTMQDTLLANIGCLAVFQVAGADARTLVWELGKDRVTEDDITSLPVHQCYVRATVGTERMPAFSMMVHKPEPGNPYTAALIRASTSAYTLPVRDLAEGDAEAQKLAERFRQEMAALKDDEDPSETEAAEETEEAQDTEEHSAASQDREKRKPRTKHNKAARTVEEDRADDQASEEDALGEEQDE